MYIKPCPWCSPRETHQIGSGTFMAAERCPDHFGDVRDVLGKMPGGIRHGYAHMDLFPVREQLIRALDPQPTSVFEFGALVGYFLVTACHAAPSINRVGWVDNEEHLPGSNAECEQNVRWIRPHAEIFVRTVTRECGEFMQADLVQVDGAHSYPDTLTDLVWATMLNPRTIFVDDYTAIPEVRAATDEFAAWKHLAVEVHETVNGLAVLRLEGAH